MEIERGPRAVVVGVDGSLGVLPAVSWAAVEAAYRGVDLHLLHVERADRQSSAEPRRWLHRALGTAAAVAPDVAVTVIREKGAVGPVLARYTERACLLVVGGRRRADGGPSEGRTAAEAIGRAGCPVVVVPPRRTGAWASTPSSRPVVAVLRAAADGPALDLAAETAARRGAPLATRLEPSQGLTTSLRAIGRGAQLIVIAPPRAPGPGRSCDDVEDLPGESPCPVMVVPVGARSADGSRDRSTGHLPGRASRLFTPLPVRHGGPGDDRERPGLVERARM